MEAKNIPSAEPVVASETLENEEAQIALGSTRILNVPFATRKTNKPEGDIRVGRFNIHPGAKVSYKYDDNIFLEADQSFSNGTFESPTSDSIYTLSGSLGVSKELEDGDPWGFEFFYEAKDENFIKTSQEDFIHHDLDVEVTLAGKGGRTQLSLFGNYLNTVDPSSSEFASNFNPRSERTLTELGERFRWALTPRTVVSLNGKMGFERFEASTLQGEDNNEFNASSSFLWAWTSLTSFGVNLIYQNTLYTAPQSTNNDSNLYGFFAVVKFEPSALISGDLGIGYQERIISGGSSRGGFSYKANLNYDFSDRTKFTLKGERSVQDSTFAATSFHIATNISLAWEQQWPLFPKIGTRAFFGFENRDFSEAQADAINDNGTLKERSDNVTTAELDLIYNIQKWLKVELGYKRSQDSSNFDDGDYVRNSLSLSVATVF